LSLLFFFWKILNFILAHHHAYISSYMASIEHIFHHGASHPDRHLFSKHMFCEFIQLQDSKQLPSAASLIHRKVEMISLSRRSWIYDYNHQFLNPDEASIYLCAPARSSTNGMISRCVLQHWHLRGWIDSLGRTRRHQLHYLSYFRNHPDVFNMREIQLRTCLIRSRVGYLPYDDSGLIGIMNNNGNREDPDSTRIEYISPMDSVCTFCWTERYHRLRRHFLHFLPIDDYDLKPCVDDVMALDISKKSIRGISLPEGWLRIWMKIKCGTQHSVPTVGK
jgi:hypothetical protein